MEKKILTLILVLIGWTMSASAQTYKFLPDNTDGKNILVYKQSTTAYALLFVKEVAVPEILAKSVTTGTLATSLNENVNDSFVYDTSLLSKSSIPSKYYILPPASFDTYNYKGMYFSPKELSFKSFEYQKVIPGTTFNGDLKRSVVLFLITLLIFILMWVCKLILAMKVGIRTSHDIVVYLSTYILMSMAFSDITNGTLFNLWVMIFLILPTSISILIAHFATEKLIGYRRVS